MRRVGRVEVLLFGLVALLLIPGGTKAERSSERGSVRRAAPKKPSGAHGSSSSSAQPQPPPSRCAPADYVCQDEEIAELKRALQRQPEENAKAAWRGYCQGRGKGMGPRGGQRR